MNLLNEVDKPKVTKTVVVYSGRFQPFHRGHYAAYEKLVSKFGSNNVYIGTSNDTSGPKSPFNFNEKKKIATTMFGVPSSRFVNINNPYKPTEILSKFDGQTTQYIAAVGDKDADRLQGKYFKPYKGKAGYGYDEIGYVYAVPPEPDPISGTDVRNNLGGDDMKAAKKFFLIAYPKFDKQIFDMITKKLKKLNEAGALGGVGMAGDFGPSTVDKSDDEEVEEGLPGGAFTGLVSPAGYIGGAPKPNDVEKLSKKLHKGDDEETHDKYVYNPIAEIIANVITEDDFNQFVKDYLGEKTGGNPALDKEINYTNTKGEQKKIKARDALRLPTDHPAHIEAKKLVGKDEPQRKEKPKSPIDKVISKDKKVKDGGNSQPTDKPAGPEPTKLSGAELKSDAEKTPEERDGEKFSEKLNTQMKSMSADDQKAAESMNNPESKERKTMVDSISNGLKKFGAGIAKWGKEKGKMVGDSFGAIKDLATTGKLGAVDDENGKKVHYSDFAKKDANGKMIMQDVPEYETDHHGHTKKDKEGNPIQAKDKQGNPKTKKAPVLDEKHADKKDLFEKSIARKDNQKHQLKHFAKDSALLLGSMALGGAGVAAVGSVLGGGGAAAAGGAAAHGAIGAFTHGVGGFAVHLAKDIAKHATLETMGLSAGKAAVGGAGLSTATMGILELYKNEGEESSENGNDKFLQKFFTTVAEKMKTYKLSDEQMLKSIEQYKKGAKGREKQSQMAAAAKLVSESVSKSKVLNIADFVQYSTERLKLKNKPKVKLILGSEYSQQNSSLGGYSPETKDIVVVVPNRMTADICRTIAHELVHRKQDEMGLIGNTIEDGKTGSPVENQANAVAGILLRDYGKKNKAIYSEGKVLTEISNMAGGNGSEDRPDGAFLPKGAARKLGARDGFNNSDKWYTNGGYIQLEFPKADPIFGDEDQNKLTVKYVDTNLPRLTGDKTKFTTNPDKAKIINEMGRGDLHFRNILKHYQKGDAKTKQKIAFVVVGNKYASLKEIVKDLMEMEYKDIQEVEKILKIELFKNYKPGYIPNIKEDSEAGGWVGPNSGGWVEDETDEDININVNPGDEVLMGKFKNKKVKVKDISSDKHGMPTINGKQATTFRTINEELLLEGGAYGHMSHPFEDMDLTFGTLKDIITKALNGDLGVVREKTDGQALAISWKNGRLIAARNKGHLANAGANAMGIEDVASKFAGRGGLTDAYNFAMKDLSAAISGLSQKQKEKIFGEGKCFMNLEVIWPTSVNVIPYGQALLIFHNTTCYDETGTAIAADQSAARTLAGMIKQVNADVQSKYIIQGPPVTEIPKKQELSSKQGTYLSKLSKLQNEFGLSDADSVSVYHQSWWENFIDTKSPVKVDKLTKEALVRRWAFGDKSLKLNTISNPELQKWAVNNDKVNVAKQQKENIKPFEEIFLGVGSEVLSFVSSVLTVHPDKAIRDMKERLKDTAKQVRIAGSPAQIQKLKTELQRLNQLGGIEKIVASEGLVFFYGGKTYKLTGTFAPLNQILGIFY